MYCLRPSALAVFWPRKLKPNLAATNLAEMLLLYQWLYQCLWTTLMLFEIDMNYLLATGVILTEKANGF